MTFNRYDKRRGKWSHQRRTWLAQRARPEITSTIHKECLATVSWSAFMLLSPKYCNVIFWHYIPSGTFLFLCVHAPQDANHELCLEVRLTYLYMQRCSAVLLIWPNSCIVMPLLNASFSWLTSTALAIFAGKRRNKSQYAYLKKYRRVVRISGTFPHRSWLSTSSSHYPY